MDVLSGGCRLCLDPFVEGFTTIDSPELKDQMEMVFRFSIEPKEGYCSDVCQSCSYTISEFYQYSEKVRQNQNLLEGNVTNIDIMDVNSKISLECIKVETLIDSMLPETTEIACEPKEEISGEEDSPDSGDDDSCDPPPDKLVTKRKRGPKIGKQERDEQDQLFNQHFSMVCDLCGMSAETFSELTRHFRKEHNRCDGYVVCCNKKFFRRPDIQDHIEVHTNPDLFRCEVCGHKCSTKITLNAHMFIKHSSESQAQPKGRLEKASKQERDEQDHLFNQHFSMDCDLCGLPAGTFSELSRHFRTEHKRSDGYVVCCNKKLFKRYDIQDHIEFHTNPDLFRCKVCGHRCNNKVALNTHMLNKHSSEAQAQRKERLETDECELTQQEEDAERSNRSKMTKQERDELDQLFNQHFSMACDLCGVSTGTFTELSRHFRTEHKRSDGYVVCCNKKLFKRYDIRDHIEFHTNPDLFRCEVCGNKYQSKITLNTHVLRKHLTVDQGPVKCDHCPKIFADKFALSQHKKRIVEYKCSKCDKMLTGMNSLRRHMAQQHEGKKRSLVCDTCGKEFLSPQNFKLHINKHKGINQRVQCEICQKWLKGNGSLRSHMKFVHTDKLDFQCDVCPEKFPHNRALTLHKFHAHTDKTHECELCGRTFKKAISLKEHRANHMGEALHSCKYCGIPKRSLTHLYRHIKLEHPIEWAQKKIKAAKRRVNKDSIPKVD